VTARASERCAANALVIAAAATVGFQVAGKSTRDALFLSTFGVDTLPRMLMAAAVVSAVLTMALTRVMSRRGPGSLVPALFGLSGILLLAEWGLTGVARPAGAVLFYLHYSGLGAILVSGLWATVTERFDPRSARRAVGRITTGASVGGLLGGILPERIGAGPGLGAMLPLLAVLHLLAGWLLLARRAPAGHRPAGPEPAAPVPVRSAREVFRSSSYLRGLAGLVALTAAAEGVLDFAFKVQISAAVPGGGGLLRAFAVFHTATTLLTILVQATLLRPLLRRAGVARIPALLPGGMVVGALAGTVLPSLVVLIAARGVEVVLRNSLFRAAYELLFTPVAPGDKRSAKLLLDVGATRVGDMAGGALVQGAIAAGLAGTQMLLGATAALGVAALWIARQLHQGYVAALERSLHLRAGALPELELDPGATLLQSFGVLDLTQCRPRPEPAAPTPTVQPVLPPSPAAALASADPVVVRAALRDGPLPRELVESVIGLLAWNEVATAAADALLAAAPSATEMLLAHLGDPDEDFAVRQRLARILGHVPGQAPFDGLLRALTDPRFEVRYRAGRALAARHLADPALQFDHQLILKTVVREVTVERRVWQTRQLIDQSDDAWSPMESEVVRDRATRSLEHVFNLLSLLLSPTPLRLAYHGLHTGDPHLRGTALEYLETVLPAPVRQRLWPFLEAGGGGSTTRRSPEAVVQELLASRQSILLALAAARERRGDGAALCLSGMP
jgi:HEAT repeat protein